MASGNPPGGHQPDSRPVNPADTATQSSTDSSINSLLSNDIVTILVGPEEVKWSIHKNLLTSISDFFKSYFSGRWKQESMDGVELKLPEDNPRAFEIFVGWAYSQPIAALNVSPVKILGPLGKTKTTFSEYLFLYVLADKFLVEALQNEVIDIVYDHCCAGYMPFAGEMRYVHLNTLAQSPLQRLLVSQWSILLLSGQQNQRLCNGPIAELLKAHGELAFAVLEEVANKNLNWNCRNGVVLKAQLLPRCNFHLHKTTPKYPPACNRGLFGA